MKFVVTGASGFVGRNLCKRLGANGHEVMALSLRRGLPESSVLAQLLGSADCVVHLAAHNPPRLSFSGVQENLFDKVNHRLAAGMGHAVRDAGSSRFIFISSARVYGAVASPLPVGEDRALDATDPYGRSKVAAEQALRSIFHDCAERLVILRPPVIYGSGRGGVPGLMARLGHLPIPVPGLFDQATKSVLSVGNFCSGVEAVALHIGAGTFNIADRGTISLGQMADLFSRDGRPKSRVPGPVPAGWANRLLPAAISHALAPLVLDCTAIEDAYGWQPPETTADAMRAAYGSD